MERNIDAKFFILSPTDEIRERLKSVIELEKYEIYIISNYKIVKSLISQFHKCIFVLSANNSSIEEDIFSYVTEIQRECGEKLLKTIIISDSANKSDLREIERSLLLNNEEINNNEHILDILDEMNIEGYRKYIRFGSRVGRIAFFRMQYRDCWRTGVINDISASGMSCSFDHYSDISVNEESTRIEICIKSKIFHLSGKFNIRRTFNNENMFVLVFARKRGSNTIKNLNSIIYKLTVDNVEEKIKELTDSL